jgi:hypothetical protein
MVGDGVGHLRARCSLPKRHGCPPRCALRCLSLAGLDSCTQWSARTLSDHLHPGFVLINSYSFLFILPLVSRSQSFPRSSRWHFLQLVITRTCCIFTRPRIVCCSHARSLLINQERWRAMSTSRSTKCTPCHSPGSSPRTPLQRSTPTRCTWSSMDPLRSFHVPAPRAWRTGCCSNRAS